MSIACLNKYSHPEALKILERDGIVIINEMYDTNDISGLSSEIYKILHESNIPGVKDIEYSVGDGKLVKIKNINTGILPTTYKVFKDSRLQELSEEFFNSKVELNTDIYAVRDIVGSSHYAHDLHFDVIQTLKFFIYLTDTNRQNGAMECIPGSHRETSNIRDYYGNKINYENRYLTRELPVNKFPVPVPVNGKVGTLVIFFSDIWHRTGNINQGERLVMRGHTRKTTA